MRSLPWSVDYFMVYYNKQLSAKKNLQYPDTIEEIIKAAEILNDPKEGISVCRPRPAHRQPADVGEHLPRLRTGFHRRQGQSAHRQPGGDRSHQAVPVSAHQGGAARRRRLQLDGMPGRLHPGSRCDVARRHRLGSAAGGPDPLARGRQGRLRAHSKGAEATRVADVRRRHWRRRNQQKQGSRVSVLRRCRN